MMRQIPSGRHSCIQTAFGVYYNKHQYQEGNNSWHNHNLMDPIVAACQRLPVH